MGIFKDEYGDVIVWRVVAASLLAVATAAAVGFALFGPRPSTDDGRKETTQTIATPAGDRDMKAELKEWLGRIEGSERLSGIGDATLEGMRLAVTSWQRSSFGEKDVALAVVGDPVTDGATTTVRLHVTHAEGETWVEATLSDGAWAIAEHPEGFDDDAPIPMADASALATVMPEGTASEVSRQLAASGIEGAGEAWTKASSVDVQGQVTRLTIWFPAQGGEPRAWDASYDESFGMLEIAPSGEAGEEAR